MERTMRCQLFPNTIIMEESWIVTLTIGSVQEVNKLFSAGIRIYILIISIRISFFPTACKFERIYFRNIPGQILAVNCYYSDFSK